MRDAWSTVDSAFDVAAAVLETRPGLDQMQLHKLLYLVQAASLAWCDTPAFSDRIEAWSYGPVVRGVAGHYKGFGKSRIEASVSGNGSLVSDRTAAILRRVVERYGDLSGPELARLTKGSGSPWAESRASGEYREAGAEITVEAMRRYHRAHGVTPIIATAAQGELAERFLAGDDDALADLMEGTTGVRPRIR